MHFQKSEKQGGESVQGFRDARFFPPFSFSFVRSFFRFSRVSDIAKERRGGGRNFPFVFVLLGFSFENVKKESERGLRGRKEIRVV